MPPILDTLLGGVFNSGLGIFSGWLSNKWAAEREKEARKENYEYGEMSAAASDSRTRALYNDLMSPASLREQYKKAGLSPSLMFGGSGVGGQTAQGAQGTGANGISPTSFGINPADLAQIKLANSQTRKNEAEAENVQTDTKIKELERDYKEMTTQLFADEYKILEVNFTDNNGNPYSIFEKATKSGSYNDFYNWAKEHFAMRESEQRILRGIYLAANEYDRDIAVLSSEEINADFQKSIVSCLMKEGFATQNAKTALQDLRKSAESAELDEHQKKAWNNLLNRLERKNATIHDIIIIATMILNNALTNYKGTSLVPIQKFNN